MADEQIYKRKVSAEEVQEGYIFVLKDHLRFFPKVGTAFKLKVGEEEHEVQIDAVDCWCMGPKKPHVHYRVPIRKFQGKFPIHRNTVVTFTKLEDGVYSISK